MSNNGDNLINNFLKTFKLITAIFAVTLLALIISSCPTPMDDALLVQVQDEFEPSIIVTSPTDDSFYYSSISN